MTRRRLTFVIAGIIFCIVSVFYVDQAVAIFIDENTTWDSYTIGAILEEMGKSHWVLIYSGVVVGLAWRSWRSVAHSHLALFASVAASGILANIIKVFICRPRPPLFLDENIYTADFFAFTIDWAWNSFPSGHATTGISIAIAGSATWPKLRWLMWTIGLAIALGRLIYNVHYASDVAAGIIIGAIVSWWCVQKLGALEVPPIQDSKVSQ